MASTKKSTGKRSTSTAKTTKKSAPRKKAATTKATSTKRASVTRKTSTRSRAGKASTANMQSFRVAKQSEPFVSLKVTVQTLYWLILAGAVLLLGLWVLNIHNKVQMIYDEIDQSTVLQQELDAKELEILREKAKDKK